MPHDGISPGLFGDYQYLGLQAKNYQFRVAVVILLVLTPMIGIFLLIGMMITISYISSVWFMSPNITGRRHTGAERQRGAHALAPGAATPHVAIRRARLQQFELRVNLDIVGIKRVFDTYRS